MILILIPSAFLEFVIAGLVFFNPALEAAQFGIQVTPDTTFLGHVIGEFAVLFGALLLWAAWQLWQRHAHGIQATRLFAFFWIVIGATLAYETQRPVFLAMDSLRGALLLGLTFAL
jgi:hypothetical protein